MIQVQDLPEQVHLGLDTPTDRRKSQHLLVEESHRYPTQISRELEISIPSQISNLQTNIEILNTPNSSRSLMSNSAPSTKSADVVTFVPPQEGTPAAEALAGQCLFLFLFCD
jgi:hypothetical protein